jgi:DNA-binding beta-propeller fold protein YncE
MRYAIRAWACAAALACASSVSAASAAGFHLIREVPMPDILGWDYLAIDPAARRLFLSNNSGVVVLDVDTLQRIGTVPDPPTFRGVGLVHGVAVASSLGRGFISHELPPSVYAFDLKTLGPLGTTATHRGTDAVVYDDFTWRVFSLNGKQPGNHDVTAIDAASGRALGTIPLPGRPEFAVADGSGHLYVNIANRSTLARIDTQALKVTTAWPLAPCKEPGGLAMDVAHRRLFVACDNQIMVMVNADTGEVIGQVPTGDGTDAVAFDPGTGDVFASNGAGTLTIAHEDSLVRLRLVSSVKTAPGARTLALDAATHRVFLLAGDFRAPPPASADNPHGYPTATPGSVKLMIFGP